MSASWFSASRELLVWQFVYERLLPRLPRLPRVEAWLLRRGGVLQGRVANYDRRRDAVEDRLDGGFRSGGTTPSEAGRFDPPMQEWLALAVSESSCPACGSNHWGTENPRGYFLVRRCHDEHGTGCKHRYRGEVNAHTITAVVSALAGEHRRFAEEPSA